MAVSSLTLFDVYRALLAITGMVSLGFSLHRGYLMFKQYQNFPEFLKEGVKAGSRKSIKLFLQNEKWELVQITILFIILCSLYYVFWNLN